MSSPTLKTRIEHLFPAQHITVTKIGIVSKDWCVVCAHRCCESTTTMFTEVDNESTEDKTTEYEDTSQ